MGYPTKKDVINRARDILALQEQIDALPNDGSVASRNALHSLMAQQSCAAPIVARWIVATLKKSRKRVTPIREEKP
jgi:hypothetical protein